MQTRYPTREDWLRFLDQPDNCDGIEGVFFMGTIADVLQLAEECKKSGNPMDLSAFAHRHHTLCRSRVVTAGILHTLDLDQAAIVDAAFSKFDYGEDESMKLWPEIATTAIRPWRTLRRLVLRPHDNRWWGTDPYDQMEAYFGEEQGRDG